MFFFVISLCLRLIWLKSKIAEDDRSSKVNKNSYLFAFKVTKSEVSQSDALTSTNSQIKLTTVAFWYFNKATNMGSSCDISLRMNLSW